MKWNDGKEKKIRVGREVNAEDFMVTHLCLNDGEYLFAVEGSTIKKVLGTVFASQRRTYRKAICISK